MDDADRGAVADPDPDADEYADADRHVDGCALIPNPWPPSNASGFGQVRPSKRRKFSSSRSGSLPARGPYIALR